MEKIKLNPDVSGSDTNLISETETETETNTDTSLNKPSDSSPVPGSDPVLILDEKYKRICKIVKKRDIRPANFITGSLDTVRQSAERMTSFSDDSVHAFSKYITEPFGNNTSKEDDEGNAGFTSKNPGEVLKPYLALLYSLIESPLRYINYVEESMTGWYASKISNGKCSDADKKIVKQQFQAFLNVLLAFYIVYNWYYMMFYKPQGKGSRVEPFIVIKTKTLTDYNKFVSLFLKYTVVPVSVVNYMLLEYVPKWEVFISKRKLLNQRGIFTLLLLFIISVIQTNGSDIIDGLVKSIHMKMDKYTGLCIASFFLFGIYSQVTVEPDFMGILAGLKNYRALFSPMSSVGRIILFFIRFSWTSAISFVSSFLVYSYLLVMSFFAITIHSNMTYKDTIKMIDAYIENPNKYNEDSPPETETFCDKISSPKMFDLPDPPSKCNPMNIFQKIVYYLTVLVYTVIKYCYKHTFEIVLVFTLLNSIKTFSTTIDNPRLRLGMIITCCAIISVLCGYSAKRYFSGLVDAEKNAVIIKKAFDELKEMKELESRINGSVDIKSEKDKLKNGVEYLLNGDVAGGIENMINKAGISGVGDVNELINKGGLSGVDGLDDIKDLMNKENIESAKNFGKPIFETGVDIFTNFMSTRINESLKDETITNEPVVKNIPTD